MGLSGAHNRNFPLVVAENWHWQQALSGFTHYSWRQPAPTLITDFYLLRQDGSGIRFTTQMYDLAERLEAGVLRMDPVVDARHIPAMRPLPAPFFGSLSAKRLVLVTDFGNLESGVELTSHQGGTISIISGASPYSVAVVAAPDIAMPVTPEPEYPLEDYKRCSES